LRSPGPPGSIRRECLVIVFAAIAVNRCIEHQIGWVSPQVRQIARCCRTIRSSLAGVRTTARSE